MKKRWVAGLIIFYFLLGLSLLCIVIMQSREKEPVKTPAAAEDFLFRDFSLVFYQQGTQGTARKQMLEGRKLTPKSKSLGIFTLPFKALHIIDSKFTFFENDRPVCVITAREADVEGVEQNIDETSFAAAFTGSIHFTGGVTVTTPEHRTLQCGQVWWNSKDDRLAARDDCRLTHEEKRIQTDSMNTDTTLKEFTVVQ